MATASGPTQSRIALENSLRKQEYEIFATLTSRRVADKVYRPNPKQHWHAKLWRVRGDTSWHGRSFEFPEATASGKTREEVREKLLKKLCYCMMATQEQARKAVLRRQGRE
jgi:hypothetical protein